MVSIAKRFAKSFLTNNYISSVFVDNFVHGTQFRGLAIASHGSEQIGFSCFQSHRRLSSAKPFGFDGGMLDCSSVDFDFQALYMNIRHFTVKRKDYMFPKLKPEDLEENFVRGSGPGGQAVNQTANCVVLKHIPSGIVIKCQETRSLQENRKIAKQRLEEKLDYELNGDQSFLGQQHIEHRKEKMSRRKRAKEKLAKKKAFKEGSRREDID